MTGKWPKVGPGRPYAAAPWAAVLRDLPPSARFNRGGAIKAPGMRIKDYACIDLDRERRTGVPEVVLAEGKAVPHLVEIVKAMVGSRGRAIVTRASPEAMEALGRLPFRQKRHPEAGIVVLLGPGFRPARAGGTVAILSAGTSDYRVAEEARVIAEQLGCHVVSAHDVGVAGVHRILDRKKALERAAVIIVVAGMEGALASLVSGLVKVPVIAVPTSCGYGSSFKGLSALLTMLNSCSPGVAVVNIDNGFGAGYFASIINI